MYLHLCSSTGHGVQSLPEVLTLAEKGVSGGRDAEDGD